MLQAGLRSRLDGAILSSCGGAGLGSSLGAPAQPRGGGDGSTGGHRGVSVHFTEWALVQGASHPQQPPHGLSSQPLSPASTAGRGRAS